MAANCLFVLNSNNVMSENARRSFLAAAERWQCDYWEHRAGGIGPSKYFPSYYRHTALAASHPFSRVLALDPDMVVNAHAPNPFEVFSDRSRIYGVADCQAPRFDPNYRHHVLRDIHHRWIGPLVDALRVSITPAEYSRHPLSAAFLLVSFPEHAPVFQLVNDWLPKVATAGLQWHGHVEQCLFNIATHITKTSVECIDERWNMISPPRDNHRMQGHIYHFTGIDSREQKPRQHTFPWWNQ